MFIRALVTVVLLAVGSGSVSAHDFWLEASPWRAAAVALKVTAGEGEHFPTRTAFTPALGWLEEWRVIGPLGDIAVMPIFERSDLAVATQVTLPFPGVYLGVMTVAPRTIVMDGKEFTEYLREEGLESIVAARQRAGQSNAPATERYARYAKVAVRSGRGEASHVMGPVGLRAEFVPQTDPTEVRPGDSLTLQLFAEGRPVAGAVVTAATEGSAVKGRTDADGRVTLPIAKDGAWLIKTVHMVPVAAGERPDDATWESYWVTLSFYTAPDPMLALP